MKFSERFGGVYFSAKDLNGDSLAVVIDDVVEKEIAGEDRVVLIFKGQEKELALNKTNGQILFEKYGDDMDHWCNKEILLVRAKTDYQGKRVACIRIEIPEKTVDKPAAM